MDKIKRNERLALMIRMLSDRPNRIHTLTYFAELFCAAKSTISEDIDLACELMERFDLGTLETVTGAAGGVRFRYTRGGERAIQVLGQMSGLLSAPERILPGGYLYLNDIFSDAQFIEPIARMLAAQFYQAEPDFVLTVETMGIPVAMMVSQAMGIPLVTARRTSRVSDGSLITINYASGSSQGVQTMSLAKRSIGTLKRALIIDDFMRGGGTAKGLCDLMSEFGVEVAGIGVIIATEQPEQKLVTGFQELLTLKALDPVLQLVQISPAERFIR